MKRFLASTPNQQSDEYEAELAEAAATASIEVLEEHVSNICSSSFASKNQKRF